MRRPRGALLVGLSVATALQLPQRAAMLRPPSLCGGVRLRMLSSEDLSSLTVVQLKERLRAAGLPVSGRKAELIDRLYTGGAATPAIAPVAAAPIWSPPSADEAAGYPPIFIEACRS